MTIENEENSKRTRSLYYIIKNFKEQIESEYKILLDEEKEYQKMRFNEMNIAFRAQTDFRIKKHHIITFRYLIQEFSELTGTSIISTLEDYTYQELIQKVGMMCSSLGAIIEDPEKEISDLKNKNEDLVRENKKIIKILENITQTEDFKINKEELDTFPEEASGLLQEAIISYKNGCYVGCCMLCGKIFEFFVMQSCKKLGEKYDGLNKGIKILSTSGKLKGDPYKEAMKIAGFYRHKAVHSPTEEFDKNKAKYVLSQLILLNKEVFSKIL